MTHLKTLRLLGAAVTGALVLAIVPALSAQSAAALNASGTAKTREGNLAGAVDDFTAAIALSHGDPALYLNRALAENGQGNFDGAIGDYTTVIKFRPKDATAYFNRGLANFLKGDLGQAEADFTKAIELKPNDPALYLHRGLTWDGMNNQEGAVADYTKAFELTPGADNEATNYAVLYRGLDLRARGAGTDLQLGNAENWKNTWSRTLATFLNHKLSESDLLKRAGADVSDDREKSRERSQANYFAGRLRLQDGDNDGARKSFAAALQNESPSEVESRVAQQAMGNIPAAH